MSEQNINILGVSGMPGSGKSEFANIARELNYHTVIMGDVIRKKVKEIGLEPNPENTARVMTDIRKTHGDEAVANLTCIEIDRLLGENRDKIIIDGIRSQKEVEYFRKHLGKVFFLVAIHAEPIVRFQRLRFRGRTDAPKTNEEFDKRDQSELSLGLGETMVYSNFVISNNETKEMFYEQAISLLKDLEGDEK